MTFSKALEAAKARNKIRRRGWNGKGIYVGVHYPSDKETLITSPFMYIDSSGLQTDNEDSPKNIVPWAPSQTDLLCDDWEIAE